MVEADQPEIHLVMVNTPGWFSQPYALSKSAMDDFKELCYPLKCLYPLLQRPQRRCRHSPLVPKILKADLVTISNFERHPIKRIFSGSSVEALVNHSDIPVLSIDLKKDT